MPGRFSQVAPALRGASNSQASGCGMNRGCEYPPQVLRRHFINAPVYGVRRGLLSPVKGFSRRPGFDHTLAHAPFPDVLKLDSPLCQV
jgi:hypothetical protein